MAKNLDIILLFDIYGEMLTKKQQDFISYYYNEDLSLSEIAELVGISRQGVRDGIKKAEEELFFYEEKLHLAERFSQAKQHADRALALCKEQNASPELVESIERLLEHMQ